VRFPVALKAIREVAEDTAPVRQRSGRGFNLRIAAKVSSGAFLLVPTAKAECRYPLGKRTRAGVTHNGQDARIDGVSRRVRFSLD
jgi:hypothetical protein